MRIKYLKYILVGVLVSCSEQKPQKPIQYKQMQIKESLVKKDFELDKEIINKYIENNDSLTFKNNSNAFWWSTLVKGEKNKRINKNVQINYTYSVYNYKDQLIYSEKEIGERYAVIGRTKEIRALTEVFKELSEGEKVILLVPSFAAYGFSGDGNKIGPAQPIIIKLRINKLKQI